MPLTKSRHRVEVGQRYRPVAGRSTWVVVALTADHGGKPHAQLALETDRTRIMTIACGGLQDRRLYTQLTEDVDRDDGPTSG